MAIIKYLETIDNHERKTRSFVFHCRATGQDDTWPEAQAWPFRERLWAENRNQARETLLKFKKEQAAILDLLDEKKVDR